MSRRLKPILLVVLLAAQFVIYQRFSTRGWDVDLIYLIIFYLAVKRGFVKGLMAAALLGLLADYLSAGVLGVFSFSRTLAAFLVAEVSRFIDFRKNIFIFMLILISLMISNLTASFFLSLILKFRYSTHLILVQPFLTALTGTLIVGTDKAKRSLDVY
jgi:rod shape-determining protein MreD